MSKEVTYSVVARKNMLKKDDPAKYYAQAQASGDVGLDEISTRVEKACTVHSADVVAVLKALEDEMVDGLSRGEIVRLGNIGTFQVGLRSRGAEKAEDFLTALARLQKDCGVDGLKMSDYGFAKEEAMALAVNARKTMGGLFLANPCEMTDEDCASVFERAYR